MKFRFVDRITAWSSHGEISGIKTVSFEEYSLKAPFGADESLPETLLLEALLQLGNWLILLSSDFQQIGLVAKLSTVRFEAALTPGRRLLMNVRLRAAREDGFVLTGEGRIGSTLAIRGLECLAVPAPAADFFNPADLRILFSEIYQPGVPAL